MIKFNKYDFLVLDGIWVLSEGEKKLLDSCELVIEPLNKFLSKISCDYSNGWRDWLRLSTNSFTVNYNFTSLHHLLHLNTRNQDIKVIYQLRINRDNRYYGCIIRVLDQKTNRSKDK